MLQQFRASFHEQPPAFSESGVARSPQACARITQFAKSQFARLTSGVFTADSSVTPDSHHPSSQSAFLGQWKHLGRFPHESLEFWLAFSILLEGGLKEMVCSKTVDVVTWPNGLCFASFHSKFVTLNGLQWEGDLMNRIKFDEDGRVTDVAVLMENMKDFDALIGAILSPDMEMTLKRAGVTLLPSP